MLYTVFSGCTSIREVQAGLELCQGKLNHFNLTRVPARSTLSDGNKKRKSKVFRSLYQRLSMSNEGLRFGVLMSGLVYYCLIKPGHPKEFKLLQLFYCTLCVHVVLIFRDEYLIINC